MKNGLVAVLSLLFCVISQAQVNSKRALVEEMPVLEKSTFECIYTHIEHDADLDKDDVFDEILQLGKSYTRYMKYGTYKSDSVLQLMDKKKRDALTYIQLNRIQVANRWQGSEFMLFNLKERTLFHKIWLLSLRYEEDIPALDWEFLPGEKTVLGYKCRKARCSFRGREWTAWYSPELKMPYGPWKLCGLPGLILMASDSSNAHTYEAIGLRTKPSEIYMSTEAIEMKKLSRQECYRKLKELCFSFCKGMWEAYNEDPVNNPRPAVKHLPYVPYELDCE